MRKSILGALLLFGCNLAYADQLSSKPGHIVFQAGGYWSSQGRAQHIDIKGLIGDEFTVTKHNAGAGLLGLAYFLDGQDLGRAQLSYGVDAFYLAKTSVSGIVIQEDLFSNLSYDYHISHYPVYATAKVKTSLPIHCLSLTLDAGIGPNFIHTADFAEHSLDGGISIPDNAFSAHTTTTFSATVSLGLQRDNVFGGALECGYRFFYLGQGYFKRNTDEIINHLNTGAAYANALVCAVRI